ncbi:MAG: peptidase T [Mycoplasmatales bacterium]
MINKQEMINRFVTYVKIDTQSDANASVRPSTKKQFDLLNLLKEQLIELGLKVDFDEENGYLYTKIEANKSGIKSVGFLAHVDTSPDMSGADVQPQIIEEYDGKDIKLNDTYTLSPTEFTELNDYVGQTLITTDGTTLLGADDKSGVTIIMELAKYYVNNPDLVHGDICLAFTTDEEIGTGADAFDVKRFGADFAYTLDGGAEGGFEYENFNAAFCKIDIEGKMIHPGSAKNKMVSALEVGMEFHHALPKEQRPEHTEGYEGFYMLNSLEGTIETASLTYIIRDHDHEKFIAKKALIQKLYQEIIEAKAIRSTIQLADQYYNMVEKIKPNPYIIEYAKQAIINKNIELKVEPIRGGTDGSKLSFMGLPCPNLFTGGHNFHGRYEYLNVDTMIKATEVAIEIVDLLVKTSEREN